jgi:SAM-dependent methyltransferase
MEAARRTNEDQATLWNGLGGRGWVEAQAALDRMLRPFQDLLLEATNAQPGSRVLDVGCGTGSTTLAFARRVGASGRSVGIDISEPMLALARERAERERLPATFVRADAQIHSFDPASFDAIVSRFGVMFFDDPIAAFANLRRAASDGAGLCLFVFRSAAENAFMTTAERAAAPLLPGAPVRDADAPGQFAFADPQRVTRILAAGGWSAIEIRPVDVACRFAASELVQFFTVLGPLGRALPQADAATRARIIATVRAAFEPYVHGADVRFDAACWMVGARATTAAQAVHD